MRSKQEILDLVLDTARGDERIRAVLLNGSRANPNAPHDPFQDFDILCLVTDVAPFRRNFEYIQRFGELMILQTPEDMGDPPPDGDGRYGYLMQFTDGNRIDLSFMPLGMIESIYEDSLTVVLLDKDGILRPFPPASESAYLPKPPDARAFFDCCNEFWWVCPYVAKGLWRRELLYARYMLDSVVREQLMKMLAWRIGTATGFAINPGKYGKYFQHYLEAEEWALLERTFAAANYEQNWEALFAMGELFRQAAHRVAAHFGFEYLDGEDSRVSAHLRHVRTLPPEAQEIY